MRGPVRAYRPRSPPPPQPQPPQPQPPAAFRGVSFNTPQPRHLTEQEREEVRRILRGQQQQQQPPDQSAASGPLPERPAPPPQRPPPPAGRQVWIPVSDGTYAKADGCTVIRDFTGKLTVTRGADGSRTIRQEPPDSGFEERMAALQRSFTGVRPRRATPPPRPPPPRTAPQYPAEEEGWLTTRSRPLTSTPRRPPRWVSPPPERPRSPPPPYQGIIVSERPQSPPPPYGEVDVRRAENAVRSKIFF